MNIRSITRQPLLTIAIHRECVRWTIGAPGKIAASGNVLLAPGAVVDGVVAQPDAVALALGESGFRGSSRMRAILAVPAQRSVFRQIEVPSLAGRKFAEMVEREIRREMPTLAENAHVSWTRAGSHGENTRVFVVGVARDVLDSHIAAARAAGLSPVSADLRIIAAARAIGEGDCVVGHVEGRDVELGIFVEGVPAIIRSVVMASDAGEEAWADQLAEEFARTLKFYRDSHRNDERVDAMPIAFVGRDAGRAVASPQIAAATGHEIAMPSLRIRMRQESDAAVFASNIGLTLKDLAA